MIEKLRESGYVATTVASEMFIPPILNGSSGSSGAWLAGMPIYYFGTPPGVQNLPSSESLSGQPGSASCQEEEEDDSIWAKRKQWSLPSSTP